MPTEGPMVFDDCEIVATFNGQVIGTLKSINYDIKRETSDENIKNTNNK